jgi:predicted MFS family arabinose efflux permease
MNAAAWRATLAATLLMALGMGGRSSFGLFVSPLNSATGLGLAAISFAAALGQLASGLVQPAIGSLAERHGAPRVMVSGALVLAAATAGLVAAGSAWLLTLLVVLVSVAGYTVGSSAILMGEVGRRVPAMQLGLAAGVVSAGGSAGQLVLGPATQWLIGLQGWVAALWATAALSLAALPLARVFARRAAGRPATAAPHAAAAPVNAALRDPRFWLIAAPFGVCGFHVGFLTTHMPGVIERCGLTPSLAGSWLAIAGAANIAGSVGVGMLMKRWASPPLLMALYLGRALSIAVLLALPASATAMLGFAVAMGLTYMAVLPPTAQLVGAHFGVQRLSTLFGVVMVVHQLGGFAGAWLGGLAAAATGSDTALWAADLVLALLAAALQRPLLRRPARPTSL